MYPNPIKPHSVMQYFGARILLKKGKKEEKRNFILVSMEILNYRHFIVSIVLFKLYLLFINFSYTNNENKFRLHHQKAHMNFKESVKKALV